MGLLTVKALLRASALRSIGQGPYRVCAAPSCTVVYFDDAGQVFETADVRVPVCQKEMPSARLMCYCFGEDEASMAREMAETGRCGAAPQVRAHIAAGRCACEVRNPRGTCCLGDVIRTVARIDAEAAGVLEPYADRCLVRWDSSGPEPAASGAVSAAGKGPVLVTIGFANARALWYRPEPWTPIRC